MNAVSLPQIVECKNITIIVLLLNQLLSHIEKNKSWNIIIESIIIIY